MLLFSARPHNSSDYSDYSAHCPTLSEYWGQMKKARERVTTKRPTTKKAGNNFLGNMFGGNKKHSSPKKPDTGILGGIANMFGNMFG